MSSESVSWTRLPYIKERVCETCGQKVLMKQGLVTSFRRKAVRHLWCGPTVLTFVHYGDEAGRVIEAAIEDYRESH
jgi:hypothetical protein